ncbi:MAG: Gfo/Idh/MocA family oxidoreductase [Balneolia bacterium]|nr:Gfo/Idh/MocA family oxidoreductase [Balneolia bacterium]
MKTIRWGILSTAKIGIEQVIPAMQQARHTQVYAIASRGAERAEKAARDLKIPKHYASYEALLEDPEIDAIYNPLPNHLHVDWSVKALEAGKHVLCEKPIGMDTEDARRLQKAAADHPDLVVMEAFMYRYHPQWPIVIDAIRKGEIGQIKDIQAHFTYYNDNPENIRNKPGIGGGGLLDIGCYCVSSTRWAFGREPKRVSATQVIDPRFGVDTLTSGILDFGDGFGTFSCSTLADAWQGMVITGTKGRIRVPIPYNPQPHEPARIHVITGGKEKVHETEMVNQFTLQAEHFARVIGEGARPHISMDETIANMKVLDALAKSAEIREWVDI